MPDEDKNFGESLVLDFRKWWRRVQAKNLGWNIHSFSLTSHRRLILGLYFFVNANDFLSSINNASVFLVEWVIFNYWNLRLISSIQSSSGHLLGWRVVIWGFSFRCMKKWMVLVVAVAAGTSYLVLDMFERSIDAVTFLSLRWAGSLAMLATLAENVLLLASLTLVLRDLNFKQSTEIWRGCGKIGIIVNDLNSGDSLARIVLGEGSSVINWRFYNLSESHLQRQVNSGFESMVHCILIRWKWLVGLAMMVLAERLHVKFISSHW